MYILKKMDFLCITFLFSLSKDQCCSKPITVKFGSHVILGQNLELQNLAKITWAVDHIKFNLIGISKYNIGFFFFFESLDTKIKDLCKKGGLRTTNPGD